MQDINYANQLLIVRYVISRQQQRGWREPFEMEIIASVMVGNRNAKGECEWIRSHVEGKKTIQVREDLRFTVITCMKLAPIVTACNRGSSHLQDECFNAPVDLLHNVL